MPSIAFVLLFVASSAVAQSPPAGADRAAVEGIVQQPDAALPLDAEFRDHAGRPVRLGDYFRGKPVILTPVYYRCPMLCGLELNGLLRALRALSLTAGNEFQIVTYSFHPGEGPELAAEKHETFAALYGRERSDGWVFLTGDAANIARVNDAVGFHARLDPQTGQYVHASGLMICAPDGRVSRYLLGVEFAPRDLRLALVEASENKIGTVADQVLLYCFMYDPARGKYGLAILRMLHGACALTAVALAGGIGWMLRRERRNPRNLPVVESG